MKNRIIITSLLISLSIIAYSQKRVSSTEIMNQLKKGSDCTISDSKIIGTLDFTDISDRICNIDFDEYFENNKITSTMIISKSSSRKDTIYCIEDIHNIHVTKELRFSNCVFNDKLSSSKIVEVSVNDKCLDIINYTSFDKKVVFENCIFKKELKFENTTFNGELIFKNCEFKKAVDFKESHMNANFTVEGSKFKDEVNFNRAYFASNANFPNTIFDEGASFISTEFTRFPQLSSTKSSKSIILYGAMKENEPLRWFVEDSNLGYPDDLQLKFQDKNKHYPTAYNLQDGARIETSRSTFSSKELSAEIINMWYSHATIPTDNEIWEVSGFIVWHQDDKFMIVEDAVVSKSGSKVYLGDKKIIKMFFSSPENYEILN